MIEKTLPMLSSHAPSPGSTRYLQQLLDRGVTQFNPSAVIQDFYRTAVDKDAVPLRTKEEYTASAAVVFPDSSIYGEIEPNLLLHSELLTAHYLVLTDQQREVIQLRLINGLEWSKVAKQLQKSERAAYRLLEEALKRLCDYLYYDGVITGELPNHPPLLGKIPA